MEHFKKFSLSFQFDPSLLPRGLRTLDLRRNMIESLIPFTRGEDEAVLELEILNLGSNMLTTLVPGYFEAFPKLQFLKLEDWRTTSWKRSRSRICKDCKLLSL